MVRGFCRAFNIWDAASGQVIRTFKEKFASVSSMALSPDGTRLISGGHSGSLRLWHAGSGELIRTFESHSKVVLSVAFSPDGMRLLSGGREAFRLWDAAISAVWFGEDRGKVWDGATGQVVGTFKRPAYWVWVRSLAFSPEGTRVLTGGVDGTLILWDVATGQLIRTFGGAQP